MPGDPVLKSTVQTNMVAAFCNKLENAKHFNLSSSVSLCETLSASSLDAIVKTTIQSAIDDRLTKPMADMLSPTAARVPQRLANQVTSYLTGQDWATIGDANTSIQGKLSVVIARYRRIGLMWPAEQTVKWAVAAVVAHMPENPSPHSIHNIVLDFKSTMESGRPPWPYSHIVKYPDAPSELPADVFEHAYSAADPPITVVVDRLSRIADQVPLRKSSAMLRAPAQPTSDQLSGLTWDNLRMLMSGVMPQVPNMPITLLPPIGRIRVGGGRLPLVDHADDSPDMMARHHHPGEAHLHQPQPLLALTAGAFPPAVPAAHQNQPMQFAPRQAMGPSSHLTMSYALGVGGTSVPAAAAAPAIAELPPHAAVANRTVGSTGGAVVVDPALRRTSADIEAAAFKAMSRRITGKRSADVDDDQPPSMKKPAMAPDNAKFEWKLVFAAIDLEKPRRNFVSNMYHAVRKTAEQAGLDAAAAKAAAQAASKEAGRVWDEQSM